MAIRLDIYHHVIIDGELGKDVKDFFNLKFNNIMASVKQLTEKVDKLQTAIDQKQEELKQKFDGLKTSIDDLKALAESGGTDEERQAISDKLDAAIADVESTLSEPVTPEPTPVEPTPEEPNPTDITEDEPAPGGNTGEVAPSEEEPTV